MENGQSETQAFPIAIIGAGFAGMGMGISLKKAGSANWIVEATRPGKATITLSGGGLSPTTFDYLL